jgi:hypothetical protein
VKQVLHVKHESNERDKRTQIASRPYFLHIQTPCSTQSALSRCVVKPGLPVVTASVGSTQMGFAATSKSRPTGPTALVGLSRNPTRIDVYAYLSQKSIYWNWPSSESFR